MAILHYSALAHLNSEVFITKNVTPWDTIILQPLSSQESDMCVLRNYWDIHPNIATTDVNPPHQIMHSVMSTVDVLGTLSCVSVV